jgi:cell division septation protein DedD
MSVDTPRYRFHNSKEAGIPLAPRKTSLEQALEEAVSRALRDNLAPLQRTADELHHAYADLVAACASSRPSNALPALLRAQSNAAALAAGLSVLSNFVAVALNPSRDQQSSEELEPADESSSVAVAEPEEEVAEAETAQESARETVAMEEPAAPAAVARPPEPELEWVEEPEEVMSAAPESAAVPPAAPPPEVEIAEEAFELANLPREEQELHRRSNRVAKVAMQDIKLLQPKEVRLGREHKDICVRLRADIDKARKEYDRRFRAIQDHPVDYFYDWMVEILAEGDAKALGEYPYPSPVLRH